MLGDGKTAYDHDHDNEKTEVSPLIAARIWFAHYCRTILRLSSPRAP